MAFKCMVPEYLGKKVVSRGNISAQATRRSQKINIPLFKTKAGQRSFSYRIDIWNNLPANV